MSTRRFTHESDHSLNDEAVMLFGDQLNGRAASLTGLAPLFVNDAASVLARAIEVAWTPSLVQSPDLIERVCKSPAPYLVAERKMRLRELSCRQDIVNMLAQAADLLIEDASIEAAYPKEPKEPLVDIHVVLDDFGIIVE